MIGFEVDKTEGIEDDTKEYGYCVVCGEKFPIEELNERGECPDHDGETIYSAEEMEDRISFMECILKKFGTY